MNCLMARITQAFNSIGRWIRLIWPRSPKIEFDAALWLNMVDELGKRSLNGSRESGAFLLVPKDQFANYVTNVAYYDDLDPKCLNGNIHVTPVAFGRLSDICEDENLRVIADVHTHPSTAIRQSCTDRDNPMFAIDGHFALILPDYGTRRIEQCEVGVHQYLGEQGWSSWVGRKANRVLRIR